MTAAENQTTSQASEERSRARAAQRERKRVRSGEYMRKARAGTPKREPKKNSKAYREINRFIDWTKLNRPSITQITVALTPDYTRRILGLFAKDGMRYRGLVLDCIGSDRSDKSRWRKRL